MAIKLINNEWCACQNDYIHEYIVDTETDIDNMPQSCTGSSALVVESGNIYMVNASDEWAKFGG